VKRKTVSKKTQSLQSRRSGAVLHDENPEGQRASLSQGQAKVIGMLSKAGFGADKITSALLTVARLTIEEVPVSYKSFADLILKYDLDVQEGEIIYRARETIRVGISRPDSLIRKGFQGWAPSLKHLCEIFLSLDRDPELFDSFVDFCSDNLGSPRLFKDDYTQDEMPFRAGLKGVFKEWVIENQDILPLRYKKD